MRGAREPLLPPRPLSPELKVEERLARRVVPAGDVRPRGREELAEKRLVARGDEPSLKPGTVQFREGKMPCRAMM